MVCGRMGKDKMQRRIIEKVLEERSRQDKKWGEQNHSAPVWGMIIGEEYGEMCQAINEFGICKNTQKITDMTVGDSFA